MKNEDEPNLEVNNNLLVKSCLKDQKDENDEVNILKKNLQFSSTCNFFSNDNDYLKSVRQSSSTHCVSKNESNIKYTKRGSHATEIDEHSKLRYDDDFIQKDKKYSLKNENSSVFYDNLIRNIKNKISDITETEENEKEEENEIKSKKSDGSEKINDDTKKFLIKNEKSSNEKERVTDSNSDSLGLILEDIKISEENKNFEVTRKNSKISEIHFIDYYKSLQKEYDDAQKHKEYESEREINNSNKNVNQKSKIEINKFEKQNLNYFTHLKIDEFEKKVQLSKSSIQFQDINKVEPKNQIIDCNQVNNISKDDQKFKARSENQINKFTSKISYFEKKLQTEISDNLKANFLNENSSSYFPKTQMTIINDNNNKNFNQPNVNNFLNLIPNNINFNLTNNKIEFLNFCISENGKNMILSTFSNEIVGGNLNNNKFNKNNISKQAKFYFDLLKEFLDYLIFNKNGCEILIKIVKHINFIDRLAIWTTIKNANFLVYSSYATTSYLVINLINSLTDISEEQFISSLLMIKYPFNLIKFHPNMMVNFIFNNLMYLSTYNNFTVTVFQSILGRFSPKSSVLYCEFITENFVFLTTNKIGKFIVQKYITTFKSINNNTKVLLVNKIIQNLSIIVNSEDGQEVIIHIVDEWDFSLTSKILKICLNKDFNQLLDKNCNLKTENKFFNEKILSLIDKLVNNSKFVLFLFRNLLLVVQN